MIDRSLRSVGCAAVLCTLVHTAGCIGEEGGATEEVTRAATGAVCIPGNPCVTSAGGPVLENLKIVNIFMSADWDADNPGTTKQAINAFTQKLVTSSYFSAAMTDYGVKSSSFGGSFDATGASRVLCPTPSIGGISDFVSIHAWIACMASAGPIPITSSDLGLNATNGNIPPPDDGTVYVIYVPKGTSVTDAGFGTCDNYSGYHVFHDVPKWAWECGIDCVGCAADFCKPLCCLACTPICGPTVHSQRFAYAMVAAECAGGNLSTLTSLATHEIIEATTDPVPPTGWIDLTTFSFSDPIHVAQAGEIGDICDDRFAPSVTMSDGNVVSAYWSIAAQACVPSQTVTAKCQDVTMPTSPGSCSAAASVNAGSFESDRSCRHRLREPSRALRARHHYRHPHRHRELRGERPGHVHREGHRGGPHASGLLVGAPKCGRDRGHDAEPRHAYGGGCMSRERDGDEQRAFHLPDRGHHRDLDRGGRGRQQRLGDADRDGNLCGRPRFMSRRQHLPNERRLRFQGLHGWRLHASVVRSSLQPGRTLWRQQ